jgi:hypothetical protein
MFFREILPVLEQAARQYKAVALTGPRQSVRRRLRRGLPAGLRWRRWLDAGCD